MKEVLSKKFWRDMKKIFDEARSDTPAAESATPATPEQSKPGEPEPPDANRTVGVPPPSE